MNTYILIFYVGMTEFICWTENWRYIMLHKC